MNTIKYIVIHCSATRSNMTYTSLQLDRDHRARGFRSAGYHFYIPALRGEDYRAEGFARPVITSTSVAMEIRRHCVR